MDVKAANVRTPLVAGYHWGHVEKIEVKEGWRPSDKNKSGDCLSLWIDVIDHDKERKRIFETLPTNLLWKIAEICRCAGVAGPKRGEDWDENVLHGAKIYIETDTYIVQSGKNMGDERPKILHYLPAEIRPANTQQAAEPVEKTRRKTTQAQKVDAVVREVASDDIPF
jgi:hypothetical protein